jgi:hypothetical protein
MSPSQRNTSSVGDMLHLKWHSPDDRCRDACLVMMYKISHDKVAVSKSDRLSGPPENYALSVISDPTM